MEVKLIKVSAQMYIKHAFKCAAEKAAKTAAGKEEGERKKQFTGYDAHKFTAKRAKDTSEKSSFVAEEKNGLKLMISSTELRTEQRKHLVFIAPSNFFRFSLCVCMYFIPFLGEMFLLLFAAAFDP